METKETLTVDQLKAMLDDMPGDAIVGVHVAADGGWAAPPIKSFIGKTDDGKVVLLVADLPELKPYAKDGDEGDDDAEADDGPHVRVAGLPPDPQRQAAIMGSTVSVLNDIIFDQNLMIRIPVSMRNYLNTLPEDAIVFLGEDQIDRALVYSEDHWDHSEVQIYLRDFDEDPEDCPECGGVQINEDDHCSKCDPDPSSLN